MGRGVGVVAGGGGCCCAHVLALCLLASAATACTEFSSCDACVGSNVSECVFVGASGECVPRANTSALTGMARVASSPAGCASLAVVEVQWVTTSSWDSGFVASVQLQTLSATTATTTVAWTVTLAMAPRVVVDSVWGGHTQQQQGATPLPYPATVVVVASEEYNGAISEETGGEVSFGMQCTAAAGFSRTEDVWWVAVELTTAADDEADTQASSVPPMNQLVWTALVQDWNATKHDDLQRSLNLALCTTTAVCSAAASVYVTAWCPTTGASRVQFHAVSRANLTTVDVGGLMLAAGVTAHNISTNSLLVSAEATTTSSWATGYVASLAVTAEHACVAARASWDILVVVDAVAAISDVWGGNWALQPLEWTTSYRALRISSDGSRDDIGDDGVSLGFQVVHPSIESEYFRYVSSGPLAVVPRAFGEAELVLDTLTTLTVTFNVTGGDVAALANADCADDVCEFPLALALMTETDVAVVTTAMCSLDDFSESVVVQHTLVIEPSATLPTLPELAAASQAALVTAGVDGVALVVEDHLLDVTFEVVARWTTGFVLSITLTPAGACSVPSWEANVFVHPGVVLFSAWNTDGTSPPTVAGDFVRYTFSNLVYNSVVRPGESVQFGAQFSHPSVESDYWASLVGDPLAVVVATEPYSELPVDILEQCGNCAGTTEGNCVSPRSGVCSLALNSCPQATFECGGTDDPDVMAAAACLCDAPAPCLSPITLRCHVAFNGTCEQGTVTCNQTSTSECGGVTCLNSGECATSEGGEAVCDCAPGYTGPTCEVASPCNPVNPCKNGGVCEAVGAQGNYSCQCVGNWTGDNCDAQVQSLFVVGSEANVDASSQFSPTASALQQAVQTTLADLAVIVPEPTVSSTKDSAGVRFAVRVLAPSQLVASIVETRLREQAALVQLNATLRGDLRELVVTGTHEEHVVFDCANEPYGQAAVDECGVCNGDNACLDCKGRPYGLARASECEQVTPTGTNPGDADTDAGTDPDTDADTETDNERGVAPECNCTLTTPACLALRALCSVSTTVAGPSAFVSCDAPRCSESVSACNEEVATAGCPSCLPGLVACEDHAGTREEKGAEVGWEPLVAVGAAMCAGLVVVVVAAVVARRRRAASRHEHARSRVEARDTDGTSGL